MQTARTHAAVWENYESKGRSSDEANVSIGLITTSVVKTAVIAGLQAVILGNDAASFQNNTLQWTQPKN